MTEDDPHAHDRMIGKKLLPALPKKVAAPETKTVWVCKCGQRNLATTKFCPRCGEPK